MDKTILVIGVVAFTALLALISYSVHVERSPITVTEVSPNCVIIEQAGYKKVRCFANVHVTEGDNVED